MSTIEELGRFLSREAAAGGTPARPSLTPPAAEVPAADGQGANGAPTGLADAVIEVPTAGTGQLGGSLFEQGALLLLDAVILDLTGGAPQAYAKMQARHANLQ
jgi:hypothetical protein